MASVILVFMLTAIPMAEAQTRPPPVPATLNAIAVNDSGDEVTLTFSPVAPTFSIVKNDSDAPAVGFALSSRATSARMPMGLKGIVRAVTVEQYDTVMIVRMRTSSMVHLAVQPGPGNTIVLKLGGGSAAVTTAATGPVKAAAGPLPKAMMPEAGADGFEVVPLKYADVSEVVGLLTNGQTVKSNDNFTPNEPDFGSAGMGGTSNFSPQPQRAADTQDEPLGQSVDEAVGIDRRLNAIILKGTPEMIARMKEKIAQIDVPVKSVILETIFVELTDTGARNVGLDFNNAAGQIGVATYQAGQYIPSGLPTDTPLTSGALQAALYAQVNAGNGRIVSKPRIAAQSGSAAKIITGDALPILTSIALSGVNGVSQQVQYVNVGVTLQIAPRVSDDGFVTSHLFCVVSSVTGYSQGYPTISQRKAETSVTVRDGETFVIGGLTQENDINNNSKMPYLGDIPLLGRLFQVDRDANSKRELYMVVTPRVVRGPATAADAPSPEAAAAAAQPR
jgi:general secretion pathway protein D